MEKVLRHSLPLATVELAAQAARLAELAAVGSILGTTALAALAASHCAASLVTAPLAHVTSSVVAHLAVRPLGGGLTGQRRPLDGRAHAAATAALAALLTAPVTGVYCSFPALLRALPSPPEAGVVDGAASYLPLLSASALPHLLHASQRCSAATSRNRRGTFQETSIGGSAGLPACLAADVHCCGGDARRRDPLRPPPTRRRHNRRLTRRRPPLTD